MLRQLVLCSSLGLVSAAHAQAVTGPCLGDWMDLGPQLMAARNPISKAWSLIALHQSADHRIEVEQCKDQNVQNNARAVVAIMTKEINFEEDNGIVTLRDNPVLHDHFVTVTTDKNGNAKNKPVCSFEKFTGQRRTGACSGVLVSPTLVLTARHCVERQDDQDFGNPEDFIVMLDWKTSSGEHPDLDLKSSDPRLLRVKRAILIKGEALGDDDDLREDAALVELKAPVADNRWIDIALDGREVRTNDTVYTLGFPKGIPMKLAPNGTVFDSVHYDRNKKTPEQAKKMFFFTDLLTFKGNSGGPVFGASDHKLKGILISSGPDYHYYAKGDCATSLCKVGAAGCDRRAAVLRISSLPAWVAALVKRKEPRQASSRLDNPHDRGPPAAP
jgi:V8-like Glu-specific endopeptidase